MPLRGTTRCPLLALLMIGASLAACEDGTADPSSPTNPEAAYALGLMAARSLAQFQLSPAELAEFERGMRDYRNDKSRVPLLGELGRIQSFQMERMNAAVERERAAADEFVRVAASEPGAEVLPSGVVFQSVLKGEGATPTPSNRAVVRAEGTLADGLAFLSSKQRGEPLGVEMKSGIPCLTEALSRMAVGGRARVTCPPHTGYAAQDRPVLIPPGAALRFELELVALTPSAAGIHP